MTNNPYLSVVVTARNDNHGGNMLRRMQIFVNGLIEQARRYQVETELLIVEWNPLPDRPRLAADLSWSIQDSPFVARIIEVPPEIHQRLRYSQSLPLFQMIAKNVGIRRAKGEFVLATNIDLLFSDALFEFLADRKLRPHKFYRVDRYDVRSQVPLEAPITEQFAYCDANILRINHKNGIEEFDSITPAPLEQAEFPATDAPAEIESPPELAIAEPKWYEKVPDSALPQLEKIRKVYKRLLPKSLRDAVLRSLPKDLTHWLITKGLLATQPVPPVVVEREPEPPVEEEVEAVELPPRWQYPQLHTNACGDFTLMSLQDWHAIKGYPEWEIFSFHLDSILLYIAHYAGIEEVILEDPVRVYHVEHASGWTPETERSQTLNKRLSSLGIPQLTMDQFSALATLMEQLGKPLIFNTEEWGMAAEILPETTLEGNVSVLESVN